MNTTQEVYPLWKFENPHTGHWILTRGRSWKEAWEYASLSYSAHTHQDIVGYTALSINDAALYSENHAGYDWLHIPPLWLQEKWMVHGKT